MAITVRTSTRKVVVLMPPAVEPGEPPMNIRVMVIARDGSLKPPMGTALKPAVRELTEWKRAPRSWEKVMTVKENRVKKRASAVRLAKGMWKSWL